MRRKSIVLVLVLAVALLLVTPVPASAKKPLRGQQELELEFFFPDPQGPPIPVCATPGNAITWVGTISFDGEVYGIAYRSLLPPPEADKKSKATHFADEWKIYERAFTSGSDCPEADDDMVMWGYDKGVQSDRNLKARANGRVLGVDTDFFDESWVGRRVHWGGVTDDTGFPLLTFTGPFRIN